MCFQFFIRFLKVGELQLEGFQAGNSLQRESSFDEAAEAEEIVRKFTSVSSMGFSDPGVGFVTGSSSPCIERRFDMD